MISWKGMVLRYRRDLLWAAIGAMIGFAIIFAVLFIGPWFTSSGLTAGPSPVVTVIANPSATTTLTPSPTGTATQVPTPTATPPEAGELSVGELVEVTGTSGDGLRLREAPGLDSTILMLAFENEVFEVREGPSEQDGYLWWYLVNPYDESKVGWGASNFLRPVDR